MVVLCCPQQLTALVTNLNFKNYGWEIETPIFPILGIFVSLGTFCSEKCLCHYSFYMQYVSGADPEIFRGGANT